MEGILRKLVRALGRIFPDCVTLSQAIAFNMFLAFFPLLLFALGLLGATSLFPDALQEIPNRLSLILPPGSSESFPRISCARRSIPGGGLRWAWAAR